jgi:aspartyl-tRNA(Asn)/glutamyl-tRNA(Gln) amidotransferase subunit A
MDNSTYLTVREMAESLRRRDMSSVELTQLHLDRIARLDVSLGAYLTVASDLALRQAKDADFRLAGSSEAGLLTGIPMQLKDNLCTLGITTTCGSRMLHDFIPPYDSTVTKRLNDQGSVLLGKGNMDEFAMGSSTERSAFKETFNPWDQSRVPGGSSGGPAVAVASGEAAFSIGSDTGGSIRQPASFCGVVGLKPTYGLVSRFGLVAFASSLDQIGPITRTVEDSAIVLNAITGYDEMDATSLYSGTDDYLVGIQNGVKGLRIGIVEDLFSDGIDTEVADITWAAINELEALGAVVESVSLPSIRAALAAYYILAPSECSANLARYDGVKYGFSDMESKGLWPALDGTRQAGFGPEVKRRIMMGTYALSSGYYDAYYKKAQQVRRVIRQEFIDAFKQVDVLATPTSPTVAFRLGEKLTDPIAMHAADVCTVPANIAGIPGISVPCGFSDGLPVGLQLLGPHLGESTILRAAYSYEQVGNWMTLHPNL